MRAAFYEAIIEYGVTGNKPTLPSSIAGYWPMIKKALDTSKQRYDAGEKGGKASKESRFGSNNKKNKDNENNKERENNKENDTAGAASEGATQQDRQDIFAEFAGTDWSNAIKELQAAALPSASESWAQTRRIAKRMQDNLYHARYGGIMTHEGRITPYQLREENRRMFRELPPAVQAWAGSPDDLADLFNRSQSDLLQFVKPGFDRAIKEASINQAFRKEQGALPSDVARTALAAHQAV